LIDSLTPAIAQDADGSLAALTPSSEQAVNDLAHLRQLAHARQFAYRLLFLERWNLWPRLTRYRAWRDLQDKWLGGTNNACERAISWWVKERYRTMCGYKRPQSAVNVSRLMV
jgi:hypothetical protein